MIIGGGAAGCFAAAKIGNSCETIVIDKNDFLCRKLRITGKGRCNLTNACGHEEFLSNISANPKFLMSALRALPPAALMEQFEQWGVALKVERGKRVFPTSNKADDVAQCLIRQLRAADVKVVKGRVTRLMLENHRVCGVELANGTAIAADFVLCATGGASYPQTGSTGDGYALAQQAGHTIVPVRPSLVALCVKQSFVKELEGLSLKNVRLRIRSADCHARDVFNEMGELLFTSYGISGPLSLSASCHMDREHGYSAHIDMKPAMNQAELDKRLLRAFGKIPNKMFANSLNEVLPSSLIPVVVNLSGIPPETRVHSVTKAQRTGLSRLLKDFSMTITGFRPISEAIVTKGGVCVDQIVPKTMESKICKGLYFVGECLDLDGYTGGFNLHIAFCTAQAAARAICAGTIVG